MRLTAAQLDKARDAFEILEGLAEELGEAWNDEDCDRLASARSSLRTEIGVQTAAGAHS